MDGDAEWLCEEVRESFGLVEFPLTPSDRVQWDGDDAGPGLQFEVGEGGVPEDIGEERFQPEGAVVLVEVDGLPDHAPGVDGGAGPGVGGREVLAVRADERLGQCAGEGEAAAVAGRGNDRDEAGAAIRADEAGFGARVLVMAELAALWEDEGDQGAGSGVESVSEPLLLVHGLGLRTAYRHNACRTIRPKATHPSKSLPVPQIQGFAPGASAVVKP